MIKMLLSRHKKLLGWLFIIIGLIIALTPFTPGSILLVIGADMVFSGHPEWQKMKNKIKNFFWSR
ncbi:MAG TPA: hypothetical protein VJJ73_00860 [Candidatus Paceibacterota bacterium]